MFKTGGAKNIGPTRRKALSNGSTLQFDTFYVVRKVE